MKSEPGTDNVRTVVIYRLGSLGDTLVSLPCFHAIARATPGARRLVLTNFPVSSKAAPLESILGSSGLMDGAMAYPVGTRSIGELLELRKKLRALKADTLYYVTAARGAKAIWRDWLFFKLCGFKNVVGTPLTADQQNWRRMPNGELEPECERLARCLAEVGPMDLQDRAFWSLNLTDQEMAVGKATIQAFHGAPYMAINMGGKVAQKDWGEANWIELLKRLTVRHGNLGLLVVGASEDSDRAQRVGAVWGGVFVNGCGQFSPRETAAAMSEACLFIGHDSGPMHLAACVGVPCIGMFGDYNEPRVWHPYGSNHQPIHEMKGVQAITIDEVERRAELLLRPAG